MLWSNVCCITINTSICHWYSVSFVLSTCFLKFYCCFEQKCLPTCKYFAYIVLQPCYLHLLHAYPKMAHFHLASIIAWHAHLCFWIIHNNLICVTNSCSFWAQHSACILWATVVFFSEEGKKKKVNVLWINKLRTLQNILFLVYSYSEVNITKNSKTHLAQFLCSLHQGVPTGPAEKGNLSTGREQNSWFSTIAASMERHRLVICHPALQKGFGKRKWGLKKDQESTILKINKVSW